VPWAAHEAIDEFYRLLEWLNSPASPFESNDCAFGGVQVNETSGVPARLECSGRVMVLARELARNVERTWVESMKNDLHRQLSIVDEDLALAMIGTTIVPVLYRALPQDAQRGSQLMISFWSWGDSEGEVMDNLRRAVIGLTQALRAIAADRRGRSQAKRL